MWSIKRWTGRPLWCHLHFSWNEWTNQMTEHKKSAPFNYNSSTLFRKRYITYKYRCFLFWSIHLDYIFSVAFHKMTHRRRCSASHSPHPLSVNEAHASSNKRKIMVKCFFNGTYPIWVLHLFLRNELEYDSKCTYVLFCAANTEFSAAAVEAPRKARLKP